MEIINETLARLHVGPGTVHENLAIFPLIADTRREPDYLTLGSFALALGWAALLVEADSTAVDTARFSYRSGNT